MLVAPGCGPGRTARRPGRRLHAEHPADGQSRCSPRPASARSGPAAPPSSAGAASATGSASSQPKVLFCVDGYRYGGRDYDRSAEMAQIVAGSTRPGAVVICPTCPAEPWWLMPRPPGALGRRGRPVRRCGADGVRVRAGAVRPSAVGPVLLRHHRLPKAITHSHGGILIEQLKLQTLNMDLRPGDRLFFFTTSGWMMWNFLVSSLLLGVRRSCTTATRPTRTRTCCGRWRRTPR